MSDPLRELAWQAAVTPSLDAPGALDVLVDALLEQGTIHEPWKPEAGLTREQRRRASRRAWSYLLQQAWEWVRIVTREHRLAAFKKMMELLDMGVLSVNQVLGYTAVEEIRVGDPVAFTDSVDAMVYAMSAERHSDPEKP